MTTEHDMPADAYDYAQDRPTFSLEERNRRWSEIRERMFVRGIDCLLLWANDQGAGMGRGNLRYVMQIPGQSIMMHTIGLFPIRGDPVVWSGMHHLHEPFNLFEAYQDWVDDVRLRTGIEAVCEEVRDRGYASGTVGIVGAWGSPVSGFQIPRNHFEALEKRLPEADLVDCTDIVQHAQVVKSEEEIETIRRASDIAHRMAERLLASEAGQQECEVYADMLHEQVASGGEATVFNMLDSGSTTNAGTKHLLHGKGIPVTPSHRTLEDGDVVMTEYHANWAGYLANAEKTVAIGNVAPQIQDIHDVCLQAHENGVSEMRPGTRLEDVWEAFRAPVEEAGMEYLEAGFHGHGLTQPVFPTVVYPQHGTDMYPKGLADHPYAGRGLEDVRLEAGMVLGTNMDVYDPDWRRDIGAMYGDTVLVTDSGPELLVDTPTEIS